MIENFPQFINTTEMAQARYVVIDNMYNRYLATDRQRSDFITVVCKQQLVKSIVVK